jgi:hypothetical protein
MKSGMYLPPPDNSDSGAPGLCSMYNYAYNRVHDKACHQRAVVAVRVFDQRLRSENFYTLDGDPGRNEWTGDTTNLLVGSGYQ